MTSKDHRAAAAKRAAAQDRSELREALKSERAGYVQRGLDARAKAVDAQLKALGDDETPPPAPDDPPPADPDPKGKPPIGKDTGGKATAPEPKTGDTPPAK